MQLYLDQVFLEGITDTDLSRRVNDILDEIPDSDWAKICKLLTSRIVFRWLRPVLRKEDKLVSRRR